MNINNNILELIIQKIDLHYESLNKIALLNKQYLEYIKEYYYDYYTSIIMPNLNIMYYINNFYTCTYCKKISSYTNELESSGIYKRICNKCRHLIDYCDKCGKYSEYGNFIDHPARGIYCKNNCEYKCIRCKTIFIDKKDILHLSDYNFMCYVCYVQKNEFEKYQNEDR